MSRFDVNPSSTQVTVRGIGDQYRTAIERLRQDVDFTVLWPPKRFSHQLELFKKEDAQADVQMDHALQRSLFGDHVYGKVADFEQIQSATSKEIYQWLQKVRRPDNALLVFVGDVSPEDVFSAAEDSFGTFGTGLPIQQAEAPPQPFRHSTSRDRITTLFRERTGVTQAEVTLMCALPPMDGDGYSAANLYTQILSDRLWTQLRERAAASYSVSPHLAVYRGNTTTIRLNADIDFGRLDQAMRALQVALHPDADSLVTQASIELGRASLATQSTWTQSTTQMIANQLFLAWNQNWSPNNVMNVARHGFDATLPKVQTVETACRASAVLGFVGDEARLRAAWIEASDVVNHER